MNLSSWLRSSIAVVIIAVAASANAGPPLQRLVPFKRLEADPNNSYPITESNGPWIIMATTFSGPQAEKQARELVHEIRKQYKLTAYTHRMQFDFTKGVQGRGLDSRGQPKKMKYQKAEQVDEVAVLVGDFISVDDPDAQRVLQRLKYAQPDSLRLEQGKGTSRSFAALRARWQQVLPEGNAKKLKGPMGTAFITTNPLLPQEYFAPKGIDKLVLDMNKDVPHSLLDCPGKYTVQVATYSGAVLIDQAKIKEVENGKKLPSRLEEAAENAHKLTEALRAKGYEAYEFHDRHASMVTIGSFESVGTPRADGKTEINPKIHIIMKTFAGEPPKPGSPQATMGASLQPKFVAGVPLDIQPMPVEVPRRSLATDYRQTSF